MTLSVIYSRASVGINAPLVRAEAHISPGLPRLSIVGLPETAVRESKERVRSAILNSQLSFPARHITVNLAPADLPKSGGRFDLAIALSILASSSQIDPELLTRYEFIAELALSGNLRPVPGVLPAALGVADSERNLIVNERNANEAALCRQTPVFGARHLLEVCAHLNGTQQLKQSPAKEISAQTLMGTDLIEVRGQSQAKRALEIAACGGHNLLFCGPPGSGKTLLASCLHRLMPPLEEPEALELAAIQSVSKAEKFSATHGVQRPFRAPHHSASPAALVGGGNPPKPGEISLAHHGVLFLDELPEFQRKTLEMLREPLEAGSITLSRAANQCRFPARFQLIAAMNPCPCGYLGDREKPCQCNGSQIQRYKKCISGPLLDRIDLHLDVPRIKPDELLNAKPVGESSTNVSQRIAQARQNRFKESGKFCAQLSQTEVETACGLNAERRNKLAKAVEQLKLSARAYFRVLKVARTIGDLAGEDRIGDHAISEALSYRPLNH